MTETHAPAVRFTGVSKSYGLVHAVREITLSVETGTVHAIVGENGAGKSTLMKILAGAVTPDSGSLHLHGMPMRSFSPRAAAQASVGMVYQELMLAGELTVWENIILGWEPNNFRFVDESEARRRILEMQRLYGLYVDLDAVVGTLPLSSQQQVEILRVLYRGANIIILDEPTSVLTPQEAAGLFNAIRSLAAAGKTVLFISHKLHEVLGIATNISVLRNSELIETRSAQGADAATLARLIIGRDFDAIRPRDWAPGAPVVTFDSVVLTSTRNAAAREGMSLTARAGTVLGVAGVAGNGQDDLVAALTGTARLSAGTISYRLTGSEPVTVSSNTRGDAVRTLREGGLAFVPMDRNRTGSAATEGLWFSELAGKFWRKDRVGQFLISLSDAHNRAKGIIEKYSVKAPGVEARPRQLSGGNLQKFIIGRELEIAGSLLVVEEPTRGIDIGSAMSIRQRIRDRAESGAAVIVVTTDLDELLEVSDEVIVMFDGTLVGPFLRRDVDANTLGLAMTGVSLETIGEGK